MKIYLSLLGLTLCCAQAVADAVDLGFNSDAARLQYVHDLRSNSLKLDGGWLHNSDNGDVVHVGLHLADMASGGRNPVQAGLGGRVVYTNGDFSNQDGFAIPIGGYVRYTLPRLNRVSIMHSGCSKTRIIKIFKRSRGREGAAKKEYGDQ